MKRTRLTAALLSIIMAASCMAACGGSSSNDSSKASGGSDSSKGDPNETVDTSEILPVAEGTVLRMACGYNSDKTGMSFTADLAGEGITLADGKTYNSGDLKPTWQAVEELLGIKIEDKYQGNSAADEYQYWDAQLDQVDMLSGTATLLSENGQQGKLVNLAEHLDQMPNFKNYLDANPIVRLSITGAAAGPNAGAIYFSPYFDGVDDIERMPLMRTDWVETLLNGEGEFSADKSGKTADPVYSPYMPTTGAIEIEVVNADGTGVETVSKNYDAYGNIVDKMNAEGSMDGVEAVNMLREYIDKTYDGYYGTDRADLFIGQNAAYDADELVALLRCVVSNPQTLNGTDSVQGLFSREDANNQRRVDIYRFAGSLFGVRGMESRLDYLYVGTDGELHDCRNEVETYEALSKMHDMASEGLISQAFINQEDVNTEKYLSDDNGFMHYDYNQTQTAYNATALDNAAGEKYMAVMVPVAKWNDGEEKYMRFTESWRSVKTDGWGISVSGVGEDVNKLNACLRLIDYAYSPEGQILMSYGPDDFIKKDASGNVETFSFNGKDWPVISDESYNDLWELQNGNYTNYARYYIGSTLSFVKSQAFEYQCTHEVGKEGAGHISNAIALGTIKHPELALADNSWYTSVPTVLPQEVAETNSINELTALSASGSFGMGKEQSNLFVDIIAKGFTGETGSDAAATAKKVSDTVADGGWGGTTYLTRRNEAWHRLTDFYNTLNG
ncbi:hypothetical protein [Ruminococcus sp.]|uniref:hypothetical protein n=1 Tax=Ruminococcus sp. TaxID=41978 RepID=UPI0025D97487|nr:hypothetical protein [Ruminococcus sp.]MBQ8967411.1 hypothetical protein [Ruminococcus sp.]